jgi:hypothetical protein
VHLGDELSGDLCNQLISRTYRLTDLSGNYTDVEQEIIIIDIVSPFGIAPPNEILTCLDLLPEVDVNVISNVVDNCSSVEVIHFGDSIGVDLCPQIIKRTYRLMDVCGNFFDVHQWFTVLDTIPPFGEISDTTYVPCIAGFPDPDVSVVQNYGDNCQFVGIEFINEIYDSQIPNTIYRIFELSDACGNTSDVMQVLVITNTFPTPSEITFDGVFAEFRPPPHRSEPGEFLLVDLPQIANVQMSLNVIERCVDLRGRAGRQARDVLLVA